jgi:hypothetical protein
MRDEPKIIQILPGDAWRALFEHEGGMYSSPVLCWALIDDGDIRAVDVDGTGGVEQIDGVQNFRGFTPPASLGEIWRREPTGDQEGEAA